jgi:hypothetical protein
MKIRKVMNHKTKTQCMKVNGKMKKKYNDSPGAYVSSSCFFHVVLLNVSYCIILSTECSVYFFSKEKER